MPSDNLRLFIAIELPAEVREALTGLQRRFQTGDRDSVVRWTALDSIHLTLKFIGETPADNRPAIESALQAAVTNYAPFSLTLQGAGCFPDLQRPRIVWAGVSGDIEHLHTVRNAIERTVAPLGYPTEDREFSPHLTIGRTRQDASRIALSALGDQVRKVERSALVTWRVEGISLMRSQLKPSGPIYTQLFHAPLKG
ncbi:MAG: RNA 2',3'-cyclic phosphodiesterase [Anaerolineae bacterium]|nr:RNA 2',3'-cyclic phosphodiesterase [Anaerolineae bacterium]